MAVRKRVFDVVLGAVLALVAAPLVLVLAGGAAVSLRAWPFFVQDRVGLGGRIFRIPKIRTLPPSAPPYADKYEIATVRTSRFCGWLRRSHLDELPQLFLVPLGQMSLVGPRPEMAMLLEKSDPAFVQVRNSVRPGCTGLWQIGSRAGVLINEAPDYDLCYLRTAGNLLDFWVLWRTLVVMFLGAGPTEPADVPSWLHGDGLVSDTRLRAAMRQRVERVSCPLPQPLSVVVPVRVSRTAGIDRIPAPAQRSA